MSGAQISEKTNVLTRRSARTKTASDWLTYSRDFTPVHLVGINARCLVALGILAKLLALLLINLKFEIINLESEVGCLTPFIISWIFAMSQKI